MTKNNSLKSPLGITSRAIPALLTIGGTLAFTASLMFETPLFKRIFLFVVFLEVSLLVWQSSVMNRSWKDYRQISERFMKKANDDNVRTKARVRKLSQKLGSVVGGPLNKSATTMPDERKNLQAEDLDLDAIISKSLNELLCDLVAKPPKSGVSYLDPIRDLSLNHICGSLRVGEVLTLGLPKHNGDGVNFSNASEMGEYIQNRGKRVGQIAVVGDRHSILEVADMQSVPELVLIEVLVDEENSQESAAPSGYLSICPVEIIFGLKVYYPTRLCMKTGIVS